MPMKLMRFLLLAAALPVSQAVPASNAAQHSLIQQSIVQPSPNTPANPLRRLRDAIIEKIWDVPKRSKPKTCANTASLVPSNYHARYGADVVLRFRFQTEDEVRALSEAIDILYLDVWEMSDEWVDIRIAKDVVPSLLGLLPESLHTSHSPVMHDLAQAVYDTYPNPSKDHQHRDWSGHTLLQPQDAVSSLPHDIFFDEYQPLSVLYPWLRLMASMFPTHASLESIGLSAQGRDIPALRVGARTDLPPDHEHPTRQTILVTGGSHAREWVSVSTAAYIAYSFITRYGDPPSLTPPNSSTTSISPSYPPSIRMVMNILGQQIGYGARTGNKHLFRSVQESIWTDPSPLDGTATTVSIIRVARTLPGTSRSKRLR